MTTGETIATAKDAGASAGALALKVSGHAVFADEGAAEGGGNPGPTPHDLPTAALAACTAMTVRCHSGRGGRPLARGLGGGEMPLRQTPGGTPLILSRLRV